MRNRTILVVENDLSEFYQSLLIVLGFDLETSSLEAFHDLLLLNCIEIVSLFEILWVDFSYLEHVSCRSVSALLSIEIVITQLFVVFRLKRQDIHSIRHVFFILAQADHGTDR